MPFKWRFAGGPMMAQHWMLAWFFRGSGPVLLRNPIFLWFFRGGGISTWHSTCNTFNLATFPSFRSNPNKFCSFPASTLRGNQPNSETPFGRADGGPHSDVYQVVYLVKLDLEMCTLTNSVDPDEMSLNAETHQCYTVDMNTTFRDRKIMTFEFPTYLLVSVDSYAPVICIHALPPTGKAVE